MIQFVGTLKAIMVAAAITSLVSTGVGLERYYAGKRAGATADRLRSDKIIATMIAEHAANVAAANQRADAIQEQWRAQRKGAQDALDRERKEWGTIGSRLAAVDADRGRLRDALAAYAAGGVSPADDSAAACRERAAALGDVLGEMVRGYAQCTAAAEDHAAGVRALQVAWPSL